MAKLTTQPAIDLLKLMESYDTDAECRAYLEDLRWPKGVECPRCQSTSISRIKARKVFDCDGCRYQFSVTAGTLFHDSHLPLPKWFLAIFLISESKKGMSALQLKRLLKVSYKTAWYLCHRIREAMREDNPNPLMGIVEVDETYIGGRARGRGRGYVGNKAMVVGAISRGGEIRLKVEKADTKAVLQGFVAQHVSPDVENIYTDEHPSYQGLDADSGEVGLHQTVNHSAKEYVRGAVHTNSIESAFGLFKRAVVGSFHRVSEKHLDRYLDEFEYRFNNRKNPYIFRNVLVRLMDGKAMPYEKLTA